MKVYNRQRFLSIPKRKKFLLTLVVPLALMLGLLPSKGLAQFNVSTLDIGALLEEPTTLNFGPDNRLYVAERFGTLNALTIERTSANNYVVTQREQINLIKEMPNYNDDGTLFSGKIERQITSLVVTGTAAQPIIYVTSSDFREGGGSLKNDKNLDTNSGIITKLTWKHSSTPATTNTDNFNDEDLWDKVDLVRGFPRSEENHSINGFEITEINGTTYALVCIGGLTNAGAPSDKFTRLPEFALASAIVSVDLDAIEAMPVKGSGLNKYVYDLPTLDDPTRPNANGIEDPDTPGYDGIDVGDPFGGNDGLNQAMLLVGEPVQIFSGGYRNAYDLVITENRRVYATENGANSGWGGVPENEGPPVGGVSAVTNNYFDPTEPGSTPSNPTSDGQFVNNKDHLELVTGTGANNLDNYVFASYYAGHPTPIRANPTGAGWWTQTGTSVGVYRTVPYDPNGVGDAADPDKALPANWPPVDPSLANPWEGDFQNPGVDDASLVNWNNNTNGIAEYTATNHSGEYQGDLIAANSKGKLFRVELNPDGSLDKLDKNFVSGLGSSTDFTALDVICEGDGDVFPGTIWVVNFTNGIVQVIEPTDYDGGTGPVCLATTDPSFDPAADYDLDGYSNSDEIDNGTDYCNGAQRPSDNDIDFISDLNDPDDDNDGILDYLDTYQIGASADIPLFYDLFNGMGIGFYGIGFTGLMTNLDNTDNYLNWLDASSDGPGPDDIYGGTNGTMTVQMTPGTAEGSANTQEKGLQFGINVDQTTGIFTIQSRMIGPFHAHGVGETQGVFIGNGDQDNYIRISLGQFGLEMVVENAGVVSIPAGFTSTDKPSVSASGVLDVFFEVNPLAGTIVPKYSIDEGPVQLLGSTVYNVPAGEILDAIQQSGMPLAVGIMGTSAPGTEYGASWDYFQVSLNPPSTASALMTLTPAAGLDANTIGDGFSITNNSGSGINIARVSVDLSTALYPDMVFDPLGTAGDSNGKCFTTKSNTGIATGLITDGTGGGPGSPNPGSCIDPFANPHNGIDGTDGYSTLSMEFNDFNPGETFEFDLDVDPLSMQGGAEISGSVSGLELIGATITIEFSDGTILSGQPYRIASSQGGSQVCIEAGSATAPTLEVVGLVDESTVGSADHTVRLSGAAGAEVSLLVVESSLLTSNTGFDAYYANNAEHITEYTATLSGAGTADISITLADNDPNGDLYYLVAAIKDGADCSNFTSNVFKLRYTPGCPGGVEDNCGVCRTGLADPDYDITCTGICSGLTVTDVFLVNADNNIDIKSLASVDTIDLLSLANAIAIRAEVDPCGENLGSVVFELVGPDVINKTEGRAPWSLTGDSSGDFNPWTPSVGNYSLTVTPYSGNNGTGTAGTPMVITLVVTEGPPCGGLQIENIYVVDAFNDVDFGVLTNGGTLNLANSSSITIRAEVEDCGETLGSVVFEVTGAMNFNKVENGAPWSLTGDSNGDFNAWNASVGSYTLTATPYSGSNGTGTMGTATTISFDVLNVLPVEWLDFRAAYNGEMKAVEIKWVTATETNNDFFAIERSQDGQNFDVIGVVKGAGTTQGNSSYQSTDASPYKGISYYRIKQVDFDGASSYSNMIEIAVIPAAPELLLFPNPTNGDTNVLMQGFQAFEEVTLTVLDLAGRQLYSKRFAASSLGSIETVLNASLPVGTYIVSGVSGSGRVTQKLVRY